MGDLFWGGAILLLMGVLVGNAGAARSVAREKPEWPSVVLMALGFFAAATGLATALGISLISAYAS